MFGTADATAAVIVLAACAAMLLGLASYHFPDRGLPALGAALLVTATAVLLLGGAVGNLNTHIGTKATGEADALASLGLGVVVIMTMALILASRSRSWGTVVWWCGVACTALAIPMLALGEPSLALGALVGGPGLLMFVAHRHPSIPASLSSFGLSSGSGTVTSDQAIAEQSRYTRIAVTLTVVTLGLIWHSGGVPARPSTAEAKVETSFDADLAKQGAVLASEYGCKGCHSVDGSAGSGPTWKGMYGAKVRLSTGVQIVRDEKYIRESIVNPDAKVVANYSSGTMAAGLGSKLQNELTVDANVRALVEYYKSVRAGSPPVDGSGTVPAGGMTGAPAK
ncbi:MAG: hypothetical protein NTX54_03555 [Chloroflexi bacterium]|nr:hypothetical protein [Chloroflexota bacterium]